MTKSSSTDFSNIQRSRRFAKKIVDELLGGGTTVMSPSRQVDRAEVPHELHSKKKGRSKPGLKPRTRSTISKAISDDTRQHPPMYDKFTIDYDEPIDSADFSNVLSPQDWGSPENVVQRFNANAAIVRDWADECQNYPINEHGDCTCSQPRRYDTRPAEVDQTHQYAQLPAIPEDQSSRSSDLIWTEQYGLPLPEHMQTEDSPAGLDCPIADPRLDQRDEAEAKPEFVSRVFGGGLPVVRWNADDWAAGAYGNPENRSSRCTTGWIVLRRPDLIGSSSSASDWELPNIDLPPFDFGDDSESKDIDEFIAQINAGISRASTTCRDAQAGKRPPSPRSLPTIIGFHRTGVPEPLSDHDTKLIEDFQQLQERRTAEFPERWAEEKRKRKLRTRSEEKVVG